MNNFLKAYQAYIFDFDGTLAASADDALNAIHATLAAHKLTKRVISPFVIGPPIEDIFASLVPEAGPADITSLVRTFRELYNAAGMPKTRLFPGIAPLLERLAGQGAQLFVATNKSRVSAFPLLERLGVLQLFTRVMCCDSRLEELGRVISKAEMIVYILDVYSLEPEHTVMIGDSPHDIEGGRAAGVHTIGVLYGYGRPEDVLAAQPMAVVNDPNWRDVLL